MSATEWMQEKVPGWERDETDWRLTTAASILAGIGTRTLLKKAWRGWKGEDPPTNPASSSTGWGEAIAWTVAVSVAVGTAKLMARRGTTAARKALAS